MKKEVASNRSSNGSNGAADTSPKLEEIDPEAVDRMLSNAMNQMTFEERNAKQEEIHGVKTLCPEETPETIHKSLIALSRELEVNSMPEKEAFLEAQALRTTYVNDDWFRVRFLQATLYNIKEAAERMLHFLDLVKTYYGTVGLQRPIQLSDLSS